MWAALIIIINNINSLFGIHSNILGSSLLLFLCRALFVSFLSRYTLTSILPTSKLDICQKIYTTGFSGIKNYALKVRKF